MTELAWLQLLHGWTKLLLEQMIDLNPLFPADLKQQLKCYLLQQPKNVDNGCTALLHLPVTGSIVAGLKFTNNENVGPTFSQTFDNMLQSGVLQPGEYLLDYVAYCNQMWFTDPLDGVAKILGSSTYWMVLYVGRALRGFASFIREEILPFVFERLYPGCKCRRATVDEDMNLHVDLILEFAGEIYYIWTYQITSTGRINIIPKLRGLRKHGLPCGKHVLMPFDIFHQVNAWQVHDVESWKLYSDAYVSKVIGMIQTGQYQDYDMLMKLDNVALTEYAMQPNIFEVVKN